MSSPPLDICKLETTEAAHGLDMNDIWRVTCLLYDETDNIRITGNPKFDTRYLDYRSNRDEASDDEERGSTRSNSQVGSFVTDVSRTGTSRQNLKADEKVRGDWKAHFFTRTVQILLHSFDPSELQDDSIKHSNVCNSLNDSETDQSECDCWGEGLDADHQMVLRRLITLPPQSAISKVYTNFFKSSNGFQAITDDERYDQMLIPFRYSHFSEENFTISAIKLLSLIVEECHFRPKLLPVRCEFFFYTQIYRTYLQNHEEWVENMSKVFADFLSEIECLEFFWVGGLRDSDVQVEGLQNAVTSVPKLFLDSTFCNPLPKLDSIEISMFKFMRYYMPKVDSCLKLIAPYFCSLDEVVDCAQLTVPYDRLENIHIAGIFEDEASDGILSSFLGNQKVLRGVKLAIKAGRMDKTLEVLAAISGDSQVENVTVNMWQVHNHTMDDFREIFENFVSADSGCCLSLSSVDHSIDLAPPTLTTVGRCRVLRLYTFNNATYGVGRLFEWLQSMSVDLLPTSVVISDSVARKVHQYVTPYLSTSARVEIVSKICIKLPPVFLSSISSNSNLQTLTLNNCKVPIMDFCQALQQLFTRNTNLQRLSYCSNKLSKLPKEELEAFFKTVFSFSRLDQLLLDISKNNLQAADLDAVGRIWSSVAPWRLLKGIIVDSHLQDYEAIRHIVG